MTLNLEPLFDFFYEWWPVALFLAVAYFGFSFILRRWRSPRRQLDSLSFAVHEIQTTLACTEQQAKKLLAIYQSSAKAINEVKTGRAVLPGEEVSNLARFGGEFRSFELGAEGVCLKTHDGGERLLALEAESFLVLGVIDPEQRPDAQGQARADRGKTYGQLFWEVEGEWQRFLLDASRMNYLWLGDKKENSAIRNFRLFLREFQESVPKLKPHQSLESFEASLRTTHYRTLAELEADATQMLPSL